MGAKILKPRSELSGGAFSIFPRNAGAEMDWPNFVSSALASAAVGTALTASLAFLLRTWFAERIKGAIRHEYDARMEQMKADLKLQGDQQLALMKAQIDRQGDILEIAAASFSDVQKATITRKIEAVDHLWGAVRRARAKIPGIVTMTDVLTDQEAADLTQHVKLKGMAAKLLEIKPEEVLADFFGDADKARPHIGEVTWALFGTYQGLLGRVIYVTRGTEASSDRRWYRDAKSLQLIRSALGPELLAEFEGLSFQRLSWLQIKLDRELMTAFDNLLTGKEYSAAALHRAVEMERMVASLKADQAKASQPLTP